MGRLALRAIDWIIGLPAVRFLGGEDGVDGENGSVSIVAKDEAGDRALRSAAEVLGVHVA